MIGVIGAFDEEVALLLKQMAIKKVEKRAGITFFKGKLLGVPVTICASGVGKVNAAKATQILKARLGKILSGDQFIANRRKSLRLRRLFDGVCVEAEGAATGQVCFCNNVPYVVIRSMSDRADRKAPKNFERFVRLAARRSQRIVLKMFRLRFRWRMLVKKGDERG